MLTSRRPGFTPLGQGCSAAERVVRPVRRRPTYGPPLGIAAHDGARSELKCENIRVNPRFPDLAGRRSAASVGAATTTWEDNRCPVWSARASI